MSLYLAKQLRAHELQPTEHQLEQLHAYLNLLQKWNRTYNLIGNAETKHIVDWHIIDSLLAIPYINGNRILDVGTGAGLPGIPLAIMLPKHQLTLLDSNGKKTRFVTQAKITLGLANVEVVNERVESYQPAAPFDIIISRAFANLVEMLQLTAHLCAPDGKFMALKGPEVANELSTLPAEFQCEQVVALPFRDKRINHQLAIITFANK